MQRFEPFIQFFHFSQNEQLGVLFDPSGASPERQSHATVIPDFKMEYDENGEPQYPPHVSIIARNFSEHAINNLKMFECDIFLVAHYHEYIIGKYQERHVGKSKGLFAKQVGFAQNLGDFEQEINQTLAQTFTNAWSQYVQERSLSKLSNHTSNAGAGFVMQASRFKHMPENTSKWPLLLAILLPIVVIGGLWLFNAINSKNQGQTALIEAMKTSSAQQQAMIDSQVNTQKQVLKEMGLDTAGANDAGCLTDPN